MCPCILWTEWAGTGWGPTEGTRGGTATFGPKIPPMDEGKRLANQGRRTEKFQLLYLASFVRFFHNQQHAFP